MKHSCVDGKLWYVPVATNFYVRGRCVISPDFNMITSKALYYTLVTYVYITEACRITCNDRSRSLLVVFYGYLKCFVSRGSTILSEVFQHYRKCKEIFINFYWIAKALAKVLLTKIIFSIFLEKLFHKTSLPAADYECFSAVLY